MPRQQPPPLMAFAAVNGHRYIVLYTPATADAACKQCGAWADNPELEFDWLDATKLAHQIRFMAPVEMPVECTGK